MNFLAGVHSKKQEISELVAIHVSVPIDVDIKVHALWKPKLGIAFCEIHGVVIVAHVFGQKPDRQENCH
jgi:hypothetical protein